MQLTTHCSFFFQAEDGIRDYKVTGVQTCALPIWPADPGAVTGERFQQPPERIRVQAHIRVANAEVLRGAGAERGIVVRPETLDLLVRNAPHRVRKPGERQRLRVGDVLGDEYAHAGGAE